MAEVHGDPKGIKKATHIFLGPKSPIYHVHETIFPKEDYEHFARFMGAFYFASSWNSTYGQCYDEPKMDTDEFCDKKTYLSIWRRIDEEGLGTNGRRSWMKYEDGLNQTMTERFSPTRDDLKPHVTTDDDKRLHQYRSLRKIPIEEKSGLARQHHTKVNRKGFNW